MLTRIVEDSFWALVQGRFGSMIRPEPVRARRILLAPWALSDGRERVFVTKIWIS
jgi:hypothetical protein